MPPGYPTFSRVEPLAAVRKSTQESGLSRKQQTVPDYRKNYALLRVCGVAGLDEFHRAAPV